jgi:antitoxin PrlF
MPRVTSKGQVTIPKEIRDELGLKAGSQVEFVRENGRVVLRRRIPEEVFDKWAGRLRGKLLGRTVDETMEILRGPRPTPDELGMAEDEARVVNPE